MSRQITGGAGDSDDGVRRLLILADQLSAMSPGPTFDMNVWASEYDTYYFPRSMEELNRCGTAACAVGYGCLNPVLQAEGLRLECGRPVFGDLTSWCAVHEFFNVSKQIAAMFFLPESYATSPTPAEVAKRIRDWINISGKERQ